MSNARKNTVKAGDILIADDGFTCIAEGERCIVGKDDCGLFVTCEAGEHYLDGQLNEHGEYVGFQKPVQS